jgi:hypothetical protein
MSKYSQLGEYLKRQSSERIPMTFSEIERITGVKLPPSAHKHRPWWSNNPRNSVMTRIWLDAGYESEQVDMERRKLVFRRVRKSGRVLASPEGAQQETPFHPLYGAMKGLIRILPGTDLTQAVDPEWADRLDQKFGETK